jgi:hypothetical protein
MSTTHTNRHGKFLGIPLFCSLAFLGLGLLLPSLASPQLPVIRFVRNPDPAPDFQLKDLDGKDLSLAGFHGKWGEKEFHLTIASPRATTT